MEEKNKDKKGMEEKQRKTVNMLTLAFAIAFMPPIWAVLAPFIGVGTGSVALICAGLFVANGNRRQDAVKISIGFLLGDLWAYIAVWVMETLQWNPNVELYATLFILGGLAVIIGETFSGIIFTPSWLCGWAIGLTIMGPMKVNQIGTLPIQLVLAWMRSRECWCAGWCVEAFRADEAFKNQGQDRVWHVRRVYAFSQDKDCRCRADCIARRENNGRYPPILRTTIPENKEKAGG